MILLCLSRNGVIVGNLTAAKELIRRGTYFADEVVTPLYSVFCLSAAVC